MLLVEDRVASIFVHCRVTPDFCFTQQLFSSHIRSFVSLFLKRVKAYPDFFVRVCEDGDADIDDHVDKNTKVDVQVQLSISAIETTVLEHWKTFFWKFLHQP